MGAYSKASEAEGRRDEADRVWLSQKDRRREESASEHQRLLDKIKHLRSLRLAKEAAEREPSQEAELCRARADRYAILAREAQGERRNELLDAADSWDALAEHNEELARRASPVVVGSSAPLPV